LRRRTTSQFTLKRAEMQMSTLDSYQYNNDTTILYIWAWKRWRWSLWKCLQKNNKKEDKRYLNWCSIFDWQKARNNAKPPDTAKLLWKAILSVLNPTLGCFYQISRKERLPVEPLY